jgi:hypothetical protein
VPSEEVIMTQCYRLATSYQGPAEVRQLLAYTQVQTRQ